MPSGGEGERADMSAEEREYQRTQRGYATGDRGVTFSHCRLQLNCGGS